MTKDEKHELADKIAIKHGCELIPAGAGGTALVILRRYQGDDFETERLTRCKAALEAAGVKPYRLVS
jgi:hypothetical protein